MRGTMVASILHQFCNSNNLNESSALRVSAERTPGACDLCENLAWAMGMSTRRGLPVTRTSEAQESNDSDASADFKLGFTEMLGLVGADGPKCTMMAYR